MVLAAGPASAVKEFEFNPVQTYQSVDASSTIVQFFVPIKSNLPAGDDLFVVFDTHMPPTWFAQFCQTSNGICYPDDAVLTFGDSNWDELQIDFFPPSGDVNIGWVDVRIYRVADPTTWVEATFAVGHGVTLPLSAYSFRNNGSAFVQANPQDVVEFFTTIRSTNNFDDELICQIEVDEPPGWFSQYCQTSTGVCYFSTANIPFPAGVVDELRVDFFCFSDDPGIGNVRLKTQSAANPAIWRALPFRVRTGAIPTDAGDEESSPAFGVTAAPNPLRERTLLTVTLDRPADVFLRIADPAGRVVWQRETGTLPVGLHPVTWDGTDANGRPLPRGVYFYRIDGAGQAATGKLTIDR
jgi:hypothetical protein